MGVQKETRLQQKVREMILARKGYSKKNWGSMTSEPGVADVTVCYRGLYIAFECKVDKNEPSAAQGIHARNVQKAGGITAAVWSVQEAKEVLDICDHYLDLPNQLPVNLTIDHIKRMMEGHQIDDCTRY